jgi:hypothetical protein
MGTKNHFNIKSIEGKKNSNKLNTKTIRLTSKKKNGVIKFEDVHNFYKDLMKSEKMKKMENAKIVITGLSPDKLETFGNGFTTIKAYNSDIKDYSDEGFYSGDGEEIVKFENFFYVDFTIITK